MTPSTFEQPALTVAVGEQLQSDYQVHELPGGVDDASDSSSLPAGLQYCSHTQTEVLVNTALLACIEYLECSPTTTHFRIEQVKHDDCLFRFYTGFITYHIFLAFFNFLGPVVIYWVFFAGQIFHALNFHGKQKFTFPKDKCSYRCTHWQHRLVLQAEVGWAGLCKIGTDSSRLNREREWSLGGLVTVFVG